MHLPTLVSSSVDSYRIAAEENAAWLQKQMSPYLFQAMADEEDALTLLAREMGRLKNNRHLILTDQEKQLVIACLNRPGSLYNSLRHIGDREISYAMFSHSNTNMPGIESELEIQRFEFDRRENHEIDLERNIDIPLSIIQKVRKELRSSFPSFDLKKFVRLLTILWQNNENYIRMSPPSRVAYLVWLFDSANASGGLFLDIANVDRDGRSETRLLFAVGNPPQGEFLLQLLEVFNRLDIGIRRAYCQTISNGIHPYFLGTFFVISRKGEDITPESSLVERLKRELCTTQILATSSPVYRDYVVEGLLSGEDAALVNSYISFCHTTLAHNQPERFGLEDVQSSFYDHPEMAQLLIKLFRIRFDPELTYREKLYVETLTEAEDAVEGYNTGHRWLDDIRRSVYRCALLLVTHTLKTNFFVVEKQDLAFRLDPGYLRMLGKEFTADLPEAL
ncbi:MAG: NAD-glutamate dehydrogenase, partial [Desulfuromonadaceae bacterium]|nr:NAD-glutamate dehydrogenase [Desulfuromonadaceae bacterium]